MADAPDTFNEDDIPIATSLEVRRSAVSPDDVAKGGEVEWKDCAGWCEQRLKAARSAECPIYVRLSLLSVDMTLYSFFLEKHQASLAIGKLFPAWPASNDVNRVDTIFSKYPRARNETVDVHTYHFSSERLHLVWSYFPRAQSTIAVAINFDELIPTVIPGLLDELETFYELAEHPMVLVLCAHKALAAHLADWMVGETTDTINTQRDTGFHNNTWNVPLGTIAPQDYSQLSAKVSGHATNFSTIAHNSTMLAQCDDFFHAECRSVAIAQAASGDAQSDSTQAYLQSHATHLSRHARMLAAEATSWQQKASILVQGLFNLIAQRDQTLNLTIARDTKKIAEESRRDTTSMKAIAAVTMVFLPGTFVASFFAMPLFNWSFGSAENAVVDRRIWIYWALTAPLTILTVLAWVVWNRLMMKPSVVEDEEMGRLLHQEGTEEEKGDNDGSGEDHLHEKDAASISKSQKSDASSVRSSKTETRRKSSRQSSKSLKES